jgi:alpha-glucosidase (family GH31 glycosyl hydrolase)
MILEYPEDRNVWPIETQYFFGDELLVAPILQPLEDTTKQNVYFPAGMWYDFWTKSKITSRGEWIEMDAAPLDKMPIWVKSGAMIPWAEERVRTFNKVGKIEKLELYGKRDGSWSCEDGEGHTFEVVKDASGKLICRDHGDMVVDIFN